jgi:peptidoglycan/xylan/chitin deacetylase (PgdA/CDA1 family)
MEKIEEVTKKDVSIFIHDVTRHTIYTLFIVAITSFITYNLVSQLVQQKIRTVSYEPKVEKQTIILPKPQEDMYTERGSPYDNRTVGSESASVIFHGSRDKKKISLTFDAEMTDGMKADYLSGNVKSSYDKRITDILNQTQTKATLFLTGMWIELYPKETEELTNNPLLEIGSHSYTDTSYHGFCYGLKQVPATLRIEEIGATEKLLRKYAHIDNRLFRFPGGCYTPEDVKLVNEANDIVVHWDVIGADGFNKNTKQIIHNVVDNTQNGSIIVLHMNGAPTAPKTADALPEIITQLKSKGYEFVKVSELLGMPSEPRVNN